MLEDLLDIFLANVRYRDLVEGDLRSMLGSIERGRQRLVELCDEYGTETVLRYVEEIIGYADRRMSRRDRGDARRRLPRRGLGRQRRLRRSSTSR